MRFIRSRLSTTQPLLAWAPPETPGPGAARHQRNAVGGAGADGGLDVVDRFGPDHGLRQLVVQHRSLVHGIGGQGGGVQGDFRRAQGRGELVDDAHAVSSSSNPAFSLRRGPAGRMG